MQICITVYADAIYLAFVLADANYLAFVLAVKTSRILYSRVFKWLVTWLSHCQTLRIGNRQNGQSIETEGYCTSNATAGDEKKTGRCIQCGEPRRWGRHSES